ncbi:MAG: hypothetical protein WA970_20080 [Gammaproteobacteria bacterium]
MYNIAGLAEDAVQTMMADGRKVLGAIPGVPQGIAGKALFRLRLPLGLLRYASP